MSESSAGICEIWMARESYKYCITIDQSFSISATSRWTSEFSSHPCLSFNFIPNYRRNFSFMTLLNNRDHNAYQQKHNLHLLGTVWQPCCISLSKYIWKSTYTCNPWGLKLWHNQAGTTKIMALLRIQKMCVKIMITLWCFCSCYLPCPCFPQLSLPPSSPSPCYQPSFAFLSIFMTVLTFLLLL